MTLRKFFLGLSFTAVAVFCLAPVVMAAVQNTSHDMTVKVLTVSKKSGTCSFCHIPHRAGGSRLWALATVTGAGWRAETISQLCWSCHLNGSTYGADQVNPFGATNKHGRTNATLIGFGDVASMPTDVPVVPAGAGTGLKCTSCHDVHNNDNRPFIRYVTQGTGVFNFNQHCLKCHGRRIQGGAGTANVTNGYSQHPTGKTLANDTGGQSLILAAVNAAFNVSPGTAAGIGKSERGYNCGGHRTDGSAGGQMNCATCHAVHGNETATFGSSTDGTTLVGAETTGYNNLLVMDGAPGTTSVPICEGCHDVVAGVSVRGPGAVGSFSHPIGTLSNTWLVAGITPASMGYRWGTGNGSIVCFSCHDFHYATANSSILHGALDAPTASSNSNCAECHAASGSLANHHPAGTAETNGTHYVNNAVVSSAVDWTTRTPTNTAVAYQFQGGVMTCYTCHGGGAHNQATAFPGLVGLIDDSQMCVDCHSFNPGNYTRSECAASNDPAPSATNRGTHFVGSIFTAAYKRGAVWSAGVSSKWGTDGGGAGNIICESCHTLRLRTGQTPKFSANTVVANVVDNIGLLVEQSGNNLNSYASVTTTGDMCTGCHGSVPGGGSTHPVLATMTTGASTAITGRIPAASVGTVTLVPANNRINCESCHRPHDAANGSGALILEDAGSTSNRTAFDHVNQATYGTAASVLYTDETPFCNLCHNY